MAYLFAQSTYVVPIVGVQTVAHVNAMPDALKIRLSEKEVSDIHAAKSFQPLFPVSFLYNFRGDQPYTTSMGLGQNQQYQMAAWVDGPLRGGGWPLHEEADKEG